VLDVAAGFEVLDAPDKRFKPVFDDQGAPAITADG
jgi:hypothetical protein